MTLRRSTSDIIKYSGTVVITLVVAAIVYYTAQAYILDRAERNIESLLLSQRGLHHYIQRVMHPVFFKAIDSGAVVKEYYAPEIFSSTYIVRTMHGFYNEELERHGRRQIIYRLAAENPRNPVNRADAHELELIKLFNTNRSITSHRAIIKLNGTSYLHYAIPFLENTQNCLLCHGKREDAPPGLLALYPGNGGFNERAGRIRAIEAIYAPMHKEYETLYIACAVIVSALLTLFGLLLLSNRLRNKVDQKTRELQTELRIRRETEQELLIQTKLLEEEITERQKVQEDLHSAKELAEAANRAKSLFLANMSHELRTPLNGVIGMAQLLDTTDTTDEQKEFLEALRLSADNLLHLINDILDITKVESGQIQFGNQGYSLRSCIEEVIAIQQTHIAEKELFLELQVPDNLPDFLIGDPVRIKQILTSLLSNAVKFTDQGGICIAIYIREQHGSKLLLDIAVSDTGIGIEPEKLTYIFDLFTQADESFTRRHGGTGLGLALSRKLAELMGGNITVESQVNKGSTFHFLLPCTTTKAV